MFIEMFTPDDLRVPELFKASGVLAGCIPTLACDGFLRCIGCQNFHPEPGKKGRQWFIANAKAKCAYARPEKPGPAQSRNDPDKLPGFAMDMGGVNCQGVANLTMSFLMKLRFGTHLGSRCSKAWWAKHKGDSRVHGSSQQK
ncbi:MAG: hypothetical protein ACK55J_16740 [Alphaproteobacteria bacterium]